MVSGYLVQRLLHTLLVVLGVVSVVFALMRLTGDPTAFLIPPEASADQRLLLRRQLGLDLPLYEQYLVYLGGLARGDLGTSYRQRIPAADVVLQRIPATLELIASSALVALLLGLGIGTISALRRGSIWDRVGSALALGGQSFPPFWTGIVGILIFSVILRWLPSSGRGGPEYLVLPALTLGASLAGIIMRLVRASLLDVLMQDYVRTGRAKGLTELTILSRHVFKNASIPIVTIVGLQVSSLIGSAIITETVFNYTGIGLTALRAIFERDFPVVQAYVLATSLVVVLLNLAVDLSYLYLDPRIRYR